MKLRQKLAMVLASAMIVTAVPVTTMAASTNKLSNTMIMVEGTKVGFESSANTAVSTSTDYTTVNHHPQLQLTITDDVNIDPNGGTTFYINAKDASFVKGAYYAANVGANKGSSTTITIDADGKPVAPHAAATPSFDIPVVQEGSTATATATVTYLSADQVQVNVTGVSTLKKNTTFAIPLFMTAKKGAPAVEVYAPHSAFSSSTAILLTSQTVGDKTLTAKIGDATKIAINGGVIAPITLTENIVGALGAKIGNGDDPATTSVVETPNIDARTVKIKLPNSSELEFDNTEIRVTGKYGFATPKDPANQTNSAIPAQASDGTPYKANEVAIIGNSVYPVYASGTNAGKVDKTTALTGNVYTGCGVSVDDTQISIVVPAWAAAGNTFGEMVISGVTVQPERRNDAKVADVKATVSGGMFADVEGTIASVKEFDVEVTCEPVEIVAGKDAKQATIKVAEYVKDVINERDEVLFTLDEGFVVEIVKAEAGTSGTYKSGYKIANVENAVLNSQRVSHDIFTLTELKDYLVQEKIVKVSDNLQVTDLILEQVSKDEYHVVGIETATTAKFDKNAANTLEVKMNVQAALGDKDGEIKVKVENRGIETQEVVVAKYTQPFAVTSEGIALKTGLKNQKGGKIVVKETAKEMFTRNGELSITVKDNDNIQIKDADITVNGVRIDEKSKTYGNGISFKIDRASDEVAEIVIENIVFDTDRSVPEGSYDLVVSGSALKSTNTKDTDICGGIKVENFITISTKNTEDIQDAATVKEVVLAVGNTTYTVDGQEKTAAVAPFIDAQNRVMVPLRLVSEEFGANVDFGVLNGVGTVTIQKEGTTVQFQNKSKVMNKNGILVPMDTEAVIKEGTTYVPLRYLANALNIDLDWNPELKTVTFKN